MHLLKFLLKQIQNAPVVEICVGQLGKKCIVQCTYVVMPTLANAHNKQQIVVIITVGYCGEPENNVTKLF